MVNTGYIQKNAQYMAKYGLLLLFRLYRSFLGVFYKAWELPVIAQVTIFTIVTVTVFMRFYMVNQAKN